MPPVDPVRSADDRRFFVAIVASCDTLAATSPLMPFAWNAFVATAFALEPFRDAQTLGSTPPLAVAAQLIARRRTRRRHGRA